MTASQQQEKKAVADANTFERVARQWHAIHESGWSDKHALTILRRFELHVFPTIGTIPVAQLTKSQVADVLTTIAARGTVEIAKRIAQITRQVLEYASDKGLIEAIPIGNTKNLIPNAKQNQCLPLPIANGSASCCDLFTLMKAALLYARRSSYCRWLQHFRM